MRIIWFSGWAHGQLAGDNLIIRVRGLGFASVSWALFELRYWAVRAPSIYWYLIDVTYYTLSLASGVTVPVSLLPSVF